MDRKNGLLMPLLLLGLLTGLCSFARADNEPQSTHRAVSPEDWTYAAMRHVLEDLDVPGLSPVHFLGDFTFNAREMAAKVWACYEASSNQEEGLPQDTRRWLIALLREFEWELSSLGKPVEDALGKLEANWEEGLQFYGHASVDLTASTGGGSPFNGQATLGIGAFPSAPQNWMVFEGGYRPSDQRVDRLGRPLLTKAASYWRGDSFRASLGYDLLRTGPGIRGSYTYSGTADPFTYGRYRDRFQLFGTRFVLDFALGSQVHAGEQVQLLTRRLEKRLSPEIEIAYVDSAKVKGLPSPFYLPLPFEFAQVIESNLGAQGAQEKDNVMMHGEVYWKASPFVEFYAEGALDEFDWSSFLQNLGIKDALANFGPFKRWGWFQGQPGANNNHGGYLLGGYFPDVLGNDRLRMRVEYARSSRLMGITNRSEPLDFFYAGRPLQHRIGPDAKGLYAEVDYLSGSDWAVKGYLEHSTRGLSRPNAEDEWLIGARGTCGLGENTALHLGLHYRRTANFNHVPGRRSQALTATLGADWWF